ncbi:hypothetical protein ACXYMX_16755 [Sporosarcina sp. CAU 1771]
MNVIRSYSSLENAVNVKNIIQDLLIIELEALLNRTGTQVYNGDSPKISQNGSECA